MKIAIPVDERNVETNVCVSFGRTPYFLIYDDETTGGAGIKAAQTIVDSKASILLTVRCGENAANLLKAANVKIFKTSSTSAKENIDDFSAGKLHLLDEIHAGFHGHGGN